MSLIRSFAFGLGSLALVAFAPSSYATPIFPGGSLSSYSDFQPSDFGTIVADTGVQAFQGIDIAGDIRFMGNFRQIVTRDTGTGLLDFIYQFQRTGGLDAIVRLTTTDYSAFTTNVGICTTCTNLVAPNGPTLYAPQVIGRSAGGGVVSFDYGNAGVDANNQTYVMVIRTNAVSYVDGSSSIIDGAVTNVFSYRPLTPMNQDAVPEPATSALVLVALAGLFTMRRRAAKARLS